MTSAKKTFPDLSSRAFEHPLDRAALMALEKVPGLDWVIRHFLSVVGERSFRLLYLASAVRVTPKQFPRIAEIYGEACTVLGIDEKPELFVRYNPVMNAMTVGVDKPFIVVTSSMLDEMNDDEVQCVLGHELGHALCGHALYRTLLEVLLNLTIVFAGIPGGGLALYAIWLALGEWSRKSELTCDRAGLLVSQDMEVSRRVLMKLAGGGHTEHMDIEEFTKQSEEYRSGGDLLDGVLKLSLLVKQTHPFPVLRLSELDRWVGSGEYERILGGDYVRRGSEPASTWLSHVKDTAKDYKDSVQGSDDPLLSLVRELTGGAVATGGELVDLLRRATGMGKKPPRKE